MTLVNSALVENFSNGGGGFFNRGVALVVNTTLTANVGAGLLNGGTVTLLNSTVTRNQGSPLTAGGIDTFAPGTVTVLNTIVAQNMGSPRDCDGPVTSLGMNLLGDTEGCTIILEPTDLMGDPGLGNFTDDGTPGHGHFPLLPTSQAINAGNEEVCPKRDQLGEQRHKPCDIGAIEFQGKVMSSQ